jgi:hypothetical protein
MVCVTTSVRHGALLALAAGFIAVTPPAAHAIELRELTGWWIAIDDTFPRLWQHSAIAPAEEILHINPDGRVQDRVLNFWAGSAQACLEHKVCSDLPVISTARLRIAGDKLSFHAVIPAADKVDTGNSDAAIRREAITAFGDWTAAIAGGRLTLRRPGKVRVLARIEPERLRKLYAGMQVSGFAPAEHWRCYLANATARDDAFAPLRSAQRTSATVPNFLERYLGVATYINAIRSTIAIAAIDESDEEKRKRLAVNPDEQMVQHFDTVLRPPRVDDRQRLRAVLSYIDGHTRATIAYQAAGATAEDEKTRSEAAASEAARTLRLARDAEAAAGAAHARASAAAAETEKAQREAAVAAEAARTAAAIARDAEAAANARHAAATASAAARQAARLAADDQRNKSDAAVGIAEAQRRNSEAADTMLATQQQKLDLAIEAATAQEQKAGAIGRAAATQHQTFERTARELAESYAALERAANEAAAAIERGKAAARQAAEAGTVTGSAAVVSDMTLDQRALVANLAIQDALRVLAAARDQARSVADAAAAGVALLRLEAEAAAQTQARDRAKAAALTEARARDRTAAEADSQAREHVRLAAAADAAAKAASVAIEAAEAAQAAHAKARTESEAASQEAAHRANLAQAAARAHSAAQDAERSANAARDRARTLSNAAADVAAKAAAIARHAAETAAAALATAQAAAASQPKGQGFLPIATADIAALAHVVGESADAKKLFCRGEFSGGPLPAATPASVPMPTPSASDAVQGHADVPLPLPRPRR